LRGEKIQVHTRMSAIKDLINITVSEQIRYVDVTPEPGRSTPRDRPPPVLHIRQRLAVSRGKAAPLGDAPAPPAHKGSLASSFSGLAARSSTGLGQRRLVLLDRHGVAVRAEAIASAVLEAQRLQRSGDDRVSRHGGQPGGQRSPLAHGPGHPGEARVLPVREKRFRA